MKPKILFIMHMPPPIHGASMVGKFIHDSKLVNESFDCWYISPSTANNIQDIAKINLNSQINIAMNNFKKQKTDKNKKEFLELILDRKKMFLYDKPTIRKYL